MIIDAHTHTFPEAIAAKAIPKMEAMAKTTAYTAGTDEALLASMEEAETDVSVLLPVATGAHQVEKLNTIAIEKNRCFDGRGLFSLGAMHPEYENYRAELARLAENGVTGIKLHPAYQNTELDDIRFLRIIERASELGLAVVIHAGLDIGIMPHNFSDVNAICTVLREIAPAKFVLAHMGGWKGWDEVESTLCGESVYMDTSFSLGAYEPPAGMFVPDEERKMLSDAQFIRMVAKHGAEKILFGTDSPWSEQKQTVEKVKACIPEESRRSLIFEQNARRVFNIK